MNDVAFFFLFIPGFTILAFIIGSAVAWMAMTVNLTAPKDAGESPHGSQPQH